jgi:hypothetical protein
MTENHPVGWNSPEEKLLSHIVLDDNIALRFSDRAGPAFFRGFIVQNRQTGQIQLNMRYRYVDRRSWYQITSPLPNATVQDQVAELKAGIKFVLETAAEKMGIKIDHDIVLYFDPPDDGGYPNRTIMWLEERDLIEFTVTKSTDVVEEMEPES